MEQDKVTWQLWSNYKVLRLITKVNNYKTYFLYVLLNQEFDLSDRWAEAFSEKFRTEVEHQEWDHLYRNSGFGPIVYWEDWWNKEWRKNYE